MVLTAAMKVALVDAPWARSPQASRAARVDPGGHATMV